MSTELIDIQKQIQNELAELGNTISAPSGHRISLKGKAFTFPDGKVTNGLIQAVILDWRSINLYYRGVYNPSKIEAPVCFAIAKKRDDLKPSPNCEDPQAESCGENNCQWDKWGSAPGGGKGKACKNTYRLAVVPVDATTDTPIWTIDLAPSSTGNFTNFVNNLKAAKSALPFQVVTTLDFDSSADFPKVTFADPQPHDNLAVMYDLRNAAQALLDKEPI